MTLIICSLDDLPTVIEDRQPSHLITLLDPASMIDTPMGFAPDRHLKIGVNDIAEPAEGLILPDETVVTRVLDFGATWDETQPMVVHCWAGISRSTASAFIIACERNPKAPELAIARAMRQAAPHASPNRRIVALADDLMGRRGRMVAAVDAMGGYDYLAAQAFDFPARH